MSILQCDHKETKFKLVAEAVVCRGKHSQCFAYRLCCVKCGKLIKK